MPIEDRTRHDRLRSLLPRVYGTDPRRHALGAILEVLADRLREADQFSERALRDRWLRTASAPRDFDVLVGVQGREGWIDAGSLPSATVEAGEREAAALGGRLVGMFAPRDQPQAVELTVLQIPRPVDLEAFADEAGGAVAALGRLLSGLDAELGEPAGSDRPSTAGGPVQRARWQLAGAELEAAYGPAGPFTALVLIRGEELEPWRDDLDAFVTELEGIDAEGRGRLPTVFLGGLPHPLELLGAALDLRRQPWESDVDAYRNRVRILAPMLSEGLATPRVLLAFALTSLHTEPCPILERPEPDSTRAYGLPPRTLDRCRLCQGGRRPPPGLRCPMRARAQMQATLTDNPRTRSTLTRSRLDPASSSSGARLRVYNDSLFAARPKIVLRVPVPSAPPPEPVGLIPRLRSLSTGEELVVPVVLRPGDELTIRPASPWEAGRPRHRQVWVDPPQGEHLLPPRAWIVRADSSFEIVDEVLMYAAGPRFGKARFAGLSEAALFDEAHFDEVLFDTPAPDAETEQFRFAAAELGAQTPALQPGENQWLFSTVSGSELAGLVGDYDMPGDFELPAPEADAPVALELSWWTRPPARFRVRVPRKPAVERALALGAASYLRKLIERVRPAGVYPIIDFAVEPIQEPLEPEDDFAALAVRGPEALEPVVELRALERSGHSEAVEPGDALRFNGIFDVTRFDSSLFNERGLEPAYFDRTVFDKALLHDLSSEIAELDESYFDFALLADYGKGSFGTAAFGQARFA